MEEVNRFIRSLKQSRRYSEQSLRAYRADLEMLLDDLAETAGNPPLEAIAPHHLRGHLAKLSAADYARTTLARKAAAIRAFFRFQIAKRGLAEDPSKGLKAVAGPRRLPGVLSTEEVERLLAAPTGESFLARRDRAIFEFLYSTGARVSEATGLDLDVLDLEEGIARLLGKGKKVRLAPIGRYAKEAIEDYLPARRDHVRDRAERAVFLNQRGGRLTDRSIRRLLKTRLLQAGLPHDVTPHTLRHSFASHLLMGGAGLRDVQELLGHASVTTTQIYTRVTAEHLLKVYEAAHPLARTSST